MSRRYASIRLPAAAEFSVRTASPAFGRAIEPKIVRKLVKLTDGRDLTRGHDFEPFDYAYRSGDGNMYYVEIKSSITAPRLGYIRAWFSDAELRFSRRRGQRYLLVVAVRTLSSVGVSRFKWKCYFIDPSVIPPFERLHAE